MNNKNFRTIKDYLIFLCRWILNVKSPTLCHYYSKCGYRDVYTITGKVRKGAK